MTYLMIHNDGHRLVWLVEYVHAEPLGECMIQRAVHAQEGQRFVVLAG